MTQVLLICNEASFTSNFRSDRMLIDSTKNGVC